MNECGCVISHTTAGVSVKLCSAHGYGTEMFSVLRRFLDMVRELEGLHGHSLPAAYTDLLHEAQALLRKVDGRQEQAGRKITAPPPAETQKVRDVPHAAAPLPQRKESVRINLACLGLFGYGSAQPGEFGSGWADGWHTRRGGRP
jgi:hypothetical protein